MIEIDGSHGEGGGQIIRSSLALSMVTATPVTIDNIRARRSNPGLQRQHLTAVHAAREVSGGGVEGAELGSRKIVFGPGVVTPGEYTFDVGTAGSTTLVLQTILPALMIAGGPSQLRLKGGTHNPFAPPYDFLARIFVPLVERMGPQIRLELKRYGFFPAGQGELIVHIQPAQKLQPLELLERGKLVNNTPEPSSPTCRCTSPSVKSTRCDPSSAGRRNASQSKKSPPPAPATSCWRN